MTPRQILLYLNAMGDRAKKETEVIEETRKDTTGKSSRPQEVTNGGAVTIGKTSTGGRSTHIDARKVKSTEELVKMTNKNFQYLDIRVNN